MAVILVTHIVEGELGEQERHKCKDYATAKEKAETLHVPGTIVVIRANRKVKKVL